jgi:hypothetical protein
MPPDVTARGQPVYQFNRAVMLNLQAPRHFSESSDAFPQQPLQRRHRLVLPRLQPGFPRCLLAEVKEMADLMAQLHQRFIIGQGL